MEKKAVFFDIDGTIFESGKQGVSEAVIHAIHQVQTLGHLCFVASGRPYSALPNFITSIGFDGCICGNGTQIVIHNTLIDERCLNLFASKEILKTIESLNLEYIILTTTHSCISAVHDELFEYYKQYQIDLDAIKTKYNLNDILPYAIKIETMTHTAEEIQCIRQKAEQLGFFVEVKSDGYIELSDKTITKGTAMLKLLKHIHIPVSQSIVLGDGLNDLDMFHTAGYSIAMGNAVDEIKQIAHEVTLPVSQDGAAYALNHLFHLSDLL